MKHLIAIVIFIIALYQFSECKADPYTQSIPMNENTNETTVYLIPGHGSDYRVFNHLKFPEGYKVKHIEFSVPQKGASMEEYARLMAKQIDTSENFMLVGVSLGGMLATEMNEFLSPQKTFIIASAKCRSELPFRYRFQKYVPIQKLIHPKVIKNGALVLQPLVEPDRKEHKETYIAMLKSKDPYLMSRGVEMILKWERKEYNSDIIHIHGNKDSTLPIRNINYNHMIKGGSHMITLNRGKDISKIIQRELAGE